MSGTSVLTGTIGKAVVGGTLVLRLTGWTMQESANPTVWGDSDSAGFTNVKAGRYHRTGTISAKFDTNKKPYTIFRSGDVGTLALWQSASAGDYYAFPSAMMDNFRLDFNPDTKEVVGWSADFQGDGKSYYPGEASAPTYTLPSS